MKDRRSYDDREIARYVLGLYDGEQADNIQQCLARDNAAAARALKWETYFLGIVDALPRSSPPNDLFSRIEESLGLAPLPSPPEKAADVVPAASGQSAPAPGAARRWRPSAASCRIWCRRRWPWLLAGVAVLCLVGVLLWAGLRSAPSSPTQQTLQLQPK